MTSLLILMLMVLAHVIEDFHLQGIMASMKQKSWWDGACAKDKEVYRNYLQGVYKHDYKAALLLHGFEWAVCVSIPCFVGCWFEPSWGFCAVVVAMGLLHSWIDHLKANLLTINLVQDQCLHMVQILILFGAYLALN